MRVLAIGLLVATTLSACVGASGDAAPRDGTSSAGPRATSAPSGTPLPSGDPGVDYYGY